MSKVAIYADINPNIIDGSSIWMVSITETLSFIFDEVWLVLKAEPVRKELISAIARIDNVQLDYVKQNSENPTVRNVPESVSRLQELHRAHHFDALVVRGLDACNACCLNNELTKILWAYVTDLPFPPEKLSKNGINRLERIAVRAKGLFSQTEFSRAYYEALAPSAPGKVYLLPPMIPQEAFALQAREKTSERLELVYSGKLAKDWKTLEMFDLPSVLRERGVDAHLTVVGEKINKDKLDHSWHIRMRESLDRAKAGEIYGVTALGALPRQESIGIIKQADLGLGWRTAELDSSMEISTKALEYSAAGVPALINRNADHEQLFGSDYPFFVSADMDVADLADHIAERGHRTAEFKNKVQEVALAYSMSSAVARLKFIFERAGVIKSDYAYGAMVPPRKILVASHDLKFAGELISELRKSDAVDLTFDHWESLHKHDEAVSRQLAAGADTIFCEFAGPNLAFFSKVVRPGQKLVARLHGFEVRNRATWFKDVDFEAVDTVVTVSDRYKQMVEDFLPELTGKVVVVPNMVDVFQFDRPKLPGAEFHLGMVGMVPFLKRPDRAIDLIEVLLAHDDRFYLYIKSRMPWDYPYVWKDKNQRYAYLDMFRRVRDSETLQKHVIFESFSTDVASWFRGIGAVLSPSAEESFHLAVAEGMSSGSSPYVWSRPGAAEIFGIENTFDGTEDIVKAILRSMDKTNFNHHKHAIESWDSVSVASKWIKILGA